MDAYLIKFAIALCIGGNNVLQSTGFGVQLFEYILCDVKVCLWRNSARKLFLPVENRIIIANCFKPIRNLLRFKHSVRRLYIQSYQILSVLLPKLIRTY